MTNLVDTMALVLFIGAARAEATPEQLEQLRERVKPAMHGRYKRTGDESEVRAIVADIMGADWEPNAEWAVWIDRLGDDD